MTSVYVLNGPNLNLLGTREPETYGSTTLADVEQGLQAQANTADVELVFRQSYYEGDLITWIQEAGAKSIPIILNAGAYTHTSIAMHDAIRGSNAHVIEVHITNVHARESFRHHSTISPVAKGIIIGFGTAVYEMALQNLLSTLKKS